MYYSKQIFICLWHIFWIDSIFALIHFWPTLLSPKSNIWFSNVTPTQSLLQFLWCSCTGATLRNATALPDIFIYLPCAAKSKSCSTKKCSRPWLQPDHRTRFKRTHQALMLGPFWWCTSPLHYHGKAPQPSYLPETTSLKKNTRFHPNLWSAWISEFRCTF